MLVITRRVGEQIFLNKGQIKLKILFIRKGNIAIGIHAPGMDIVREELSQNQENINSIADALPTVRTLKK